MFLVSSSKDVAVAAATLTDRLEAWSRDRRAGIEVFRWDEQTAGGALLSARSPVQVQIERMVQGRISCTLVLFGERIGIPLRGEPPALAKRMLDEWRMDGLVHPWPEVQAEVDACLAQGQFPLTGTVYELLAALHDDTPSDLVVAYVADRNVEHGTQINAIKFNGGVWFDRALPADPLRPMDRTHFEEREYWPQVKGLLNLLKALTSRRRGLPVRRCASEAAMVDWLMFAAQKRLKRTLSDRAERSPFKRTMESYRVVDLPLPDRTELRGELKKALVECAAAGEMLLLEGPSGCGKSSLLQRGLLGDLPRDFEHAVVTACRPEQLDARDESTPFLALLGHIADALDAAGLNHLGKVRKPPGGGAPKMASDAAAAVGQALERAGKRLVIGVDQFEELIDLSMLEERQRDTSGGWWQVLRLLGAMAKLEQVAVAGTLESRRQSAMQGLALARTAGLVVRCENVDFPIGEVRDFVRITTAGARLMFARSLVDVIYAMVYRFEESRAKTMGEHASASFLPLLALWMHRLFVRFQDRMYGEDDNVSRKFEQSSREITEEDLEERGISLDIAPLVAELVQAAWDEAGDHIIRPSGRLRAVMIDQSALFEHLRALLQDPNAHRWIAPFIARDGSLDVHRLLAKAPELGLKLNGTKTEPVSEEVPHPVTMDNFFSGLTALDHARKMRLLDRPRSAVSKQVGDLIAAFEKRRLLVPAGANRVRLVHQAVIDHWPPARAWIEARQSQFERIRRLNHVARSLKNRYQSIEQVVADNPELPSDAVCVLHDKREVWTSQQEQSEREATLRKACLDLIASVPDGSKVVRVGDIATSFVHEAARYNLIEPLNRWLAASPGLVNLKLAKGTPLHSAAWSALDATKVLLDKGAVIREPDDEDWHPISAAIVAGRTDIVEVFAGAYADCRAVVGPGLTTLAHLGARSQSFDVLARLVRGAEGPLPVDGHGHSPLHSAASEGHAAHISLLLPLCNPCGRDQQGYMPIHVAAFRNHAAAIEALLGHVELTSAERDAMLLGTDVTSPPWESPLMLAATMAHPAALGVLLAHTDPSDARHGSDGRHPIVQVTARSPGGAPLADRVSECVALLLADRDLTPKDAEKARAAASDFPDAQRIIDEWMVERGEFGGLSATRLIDWLVGSRPEAALTVLRKAAGILDAVDSHGQSAAVRLLRDGLSQTIAEALELGIEPSANAELFRLEAALVLHKRLYPLPQAPAQPMHCLVECLVDGPEAPLHRLLLEMLPSASSTWSLLHRLAIRGEQEAFAAVLGDLHGPLPLDTFGRLPSKLATPQERAAFEALEDTYQARESSHDSIRPASPACDSAAADPG